MKIRIISENFGSYLHQRRSWSEADPDPKSFVIEVPAIPDKDTVVAFRVPTDAEEASPLFLGVVQEVVMLDEATVWVFVSQPRRIKNS